ncbi:MAG TPA: ATP-binding protein [Micromonosporaceae bacterium]|nr:ATP-binding protein [Micromonosporaceae bacterium]
MRLRTACAGVAVVGVALLVGAVALVASLHAVLVREVRATASLRAAEAVQVLEAGANPVAMASRDDDVVLQVLGPTGGVLSATPNVAGQPALARLPPGQSREVEVPFDDDTFLVASVAASGGRTILVAYSLDTVAETTRALATLLVVGVPAVLLVAGATTWRLVGRALAPVDAIRAEVDSISAAQLHRRVPQPPAGDEIGRLAGTMNRMLDRLERARARERRFIADASHELRSPIAAIRQHAEVALAHPDRLPAGELARTAHAESLRMQALVDDLLLLAQADEHALPLRRRLVDLDDLVLEEVRRLRAVAEVAVNPGGVSAAQVDGDPAALRRVLRNLGDNAARHARSQVAFALSERDGWAQLHVDDDGPGVPAGDRSRVFERFVRLDGARARTGGGSGLGLAIVAEVVAAHGGTVAVADAPLGGARITVRLPVAHG